MNVDTILSFPRPRHTRDYASRRARRESMRNKVLDSRLRGNDELIGAALKHPTLLNTLND